MRARCAMWQYLGRGSRLIALPIGVFAGAVITAGSDNYGAAREHWERCRSRQRGGGSFSIREHLAAYATAGRFFSGARMS